MRKRNYQVRLHLSKSELGWIAKNATGKLAERAKATADTVDEVSIMASGINATCYSPSDLAVTESYLLPIWKLNKKQLQNLIDYLCSI